MDVNGIVIGAATGFAQDQCFFIGPPELFEKTVPLMSKNLDERLSSRRESPGCRPESKAAEDEPNS
jgi:hypothetical protein